MEEINEKVRQCLQELCNSSDAILIMFGFSDDEVFDRTGKILQEVSNHFSKAFRKSEDRRIALLKEQTKNCQKINIMKSKKLSK